MTGVIVLLELNKMLFVQVRMKFKILGCSGTSFSGRLYPTLRPEQLSSRFLAERSIQATRLAGQARAALNGGQDCSGIEAFTEWDVEVSCR